MTTQTAAVGGTSIAISGATHSGRERAENQDCFVIDAALGLCAVCDGVGGEASGEVASRIACDVIQHAVQRRLHALAGEFLPAVRLSFNEMELLLRSALLDAHADVIEDGNVRGARGMATTAIAILVHGDKATLCWAGDSRAYRWRANRLERLSRDHSVPSAQESGRHPAGKGPLTQVLGGGRDLFAPDSLSLAIRSGDVFLLCSDGLSDMVPERRIADVMRSGDPPLSIAGHLVDAANEAGGRDNVTVVVIQIVGPVPQLTTRQLGSGRERFANAIAGAVLFAAGLALGAFVALTLTATTGPAQHPVVHAVRPAVAAPAAPPPQQPMNTLERASP